jgi:hypothetical protein
LVPSSSFAQEIVSSNPSAASGTMGMSAEEMMNPLLYDEIGDRKPESEQTEVQPDATILTELDLDAAEDTIDTQDSKRTNSSRNLSLFNLLNRDCMEEVFLALSEILKRPSHEEDAMTTEATASPKDFWTGKVQLNRNPGQEVGAYCSMTLYGFLCCIIFNSHFHVSLLAFENTVLDAIGCFFGSESRGTSKVLQLLPCSFDGSLRLRWI